MKKQRKILKKDFLNELQTRVDKIELLNVLGSNKVHLDGEGAVRGTCPIHKGDNPSAFRILDNNGWACYTRDCNQGKFQDLITLVKICLGKSFIESVAFLAQMSGMEIDYRIETSFDKEVIDSSSWSNIAADRNIDHLNISEYVVYDMIRHRINYLDQRGISNETQNEFEIGATKNWKGFLNEERVSFPICSSFGYVGIQGRAITGTSRYGDNPFPRNKKYDNYHSFSKSKCLYNFDRAKIYSQITGRMIVVEGIIDVLKLYENGIRDVVCCLGSSISEEQFKILSTGFWKIYLMLDHDKSGNNGIDKFIEEYGDYFDIFICNLPDEKDPADLTIKETFEVLNNAKKNSLC